MNSQNCRFVHVQSPPTQNCPFLFNIPRVIAMQAIYKKTWEILTFWAKNYGLLDKNTHVNLTYRSYLAYCRATDFDICSLTPICDILGMSWITFVDKKSTVIFYQNNLCWIVLEGKKMLFKFFKKKIMRIFFHKWRSTIFPGFQVHLCSSHDISGWWRHVITPSGVQLLLLKRFQINIK